MGSSLRRGVRSEADGGACLRRELDELHAADDGGAPHQVALVELALLEARRADVDRPAGLRHAAASGDLEPLVAVGGQDDGRVRLLERPWPDGDAIVVEV